jgi:hypothetical protein
MRIRVLGLAFGLLVSMLATSPVVAGGGSGGSLAHRPDGWVRYYSRVREDITIVEPGPWKGDDIYNTTGKHQTAKHSELSGEPPAIYWVFKVAIENDGSSDSFRVHATGTGGVVKYFRGTNNITAAVNAGTYETPTLGHGDKLIIKVRVYVGDPDTWTVRLVTITSVGNSNRQDAVRIKSRWEGCGC